MGTVGTIVLTTSTIGSGNSSGPACNIEITAGGWDVHWGILVTHLKGGARRAMGLR